MLDRLYMPLLALATLAVIVLGMVWPQGLGDRSPAPFGHTPLQQEPPMQAAMQRETEASESHRRQERETYRQLQSQVLSPNQ